MPVQGQLSAEVLRTAPQGSTLQPAVRNSSDAGSLRGSVLFLLCARVTGYSELAN